MIKPSMILSTQSFRRKPESSQNITGDAYFGFMVIDPLLDAGSVIPDLIRDRHDGIQNSVLPVTVVVGLINKGFLIILKMGAILNSKIIDMQRR